MILFFRQGGIAEYRFLIIWNCQLLLSLGIIVHFGVCNRSLCFFGDSVSGFSPFASVFVVYIPSKLWWFYLFLDRPRYF